MKLLLTRFERVERATIGLLRIDGKFQCFILEDEVRPDGVKIPGETAIPAGTYKVVIGWSEKRKCDVPHIIGVPNFTSIEVHWGNSDKDTLGCLLTGSTHTVGEDWVAGSKVAYDNLFALVQNETDMQIEIEEKFA